MVAVRDPGYAVLTLPRRVVARRSGGTGNGVGRLVGFVSAESHYSWDKAFNLCGLGTDALVKVAVDGTGAMDMAALAEAIAAAEGRGDRPFLIAATTGTTVLGAFDDVAAAADVRDAYNQRVTASERGSGSCSSRPRIFLAVDACWGGAALFHAGLRARTCAGIERADVVAIDLHKLLGATQQCAALLVRQPGLLAAANSSKASYLFQADKNNAGCDMGDLTLTCGRRADAVKAWFMWKARGDTGLHARVQHAMSLLDFAQRLMGGGGSIGSSYRVDGGGAGGDGDGDAEDMTVRDAGGHPVFAVLHRSPLNLCFYAVPRSIRPLASVEQWSAPSLTSQPLQGGAASTAPPAWFIALNDAAPRIKDEMQRRGCGLVGYQPVRAGLPQCFRLVLPGAREAGLTQQCHIRQLLRDFQTAADKL